MEIKAQYVALSKDAKDLVKKWKNEREQINRPSWDKYFLNLALECSKRSHDAQTKVGCILTSKDNEIIASGYNGFPNGLLDDILPNTRPEKYNWMDHAEYNAILNCAKQGKSTLNSTMYVTGPPCFSCLKMMWKCGINKIVYLDTYIHCITKEEKTRTEILLFMIGKRIEICKYSKNFLKTD